jgi:hypothetical protein
MWWHTVTHGMGIEEETGEWSGLPVPFSLHRNMVYPALLPLMCTPGLPVVDWTDAPADLSGLVRFAESRNLFSARVPSRFNWPLTQTGYSRNLVKLLSFFFVKRRIKFSLTLSLLSHRIFFEWSCPSARRLSQASHLGGPGLVIG